MKYKDLKHLDTVKSRASTTQNRTKTAHSAKNLRTKPIQVLVVAEPETFSLRDMAHLKSRHGMHLTFCKNAYDCLTLSDHYAFDIVLFWQGGEAIHPYMQMISTGKAMHGRRALYINLGADQPLTGVDVTLPHPRALGSLNGSWPTGGYKN